MKKPLVVALTLALVLGGGWWGWQALYGDDGTAAPVTATVTRGTVERSVLATGAIEASQLVSVGARVSGQVETLAVELGQLVQKGDLIAQIDSDDQKNAVLQAEATLKQIEAQIAAKRASILQARLLLDRRRTLNEKNLTSSEDLQAAEAGLTVAEAELDQIEAQKTQAEVSLSSARTELDRTRITAPITGTVVAIVTDEGVTVNANTSSPTLVKLAALDRMVIKAEISEADVVQVQPGQPVSFTLSGAPDLQFDATLRAIEPAPATIEDSDSVSTDSAIYYNALLDVDNPDGILRIGMTAEVRILLAQAKDVLTIPAAALGARAEDGTRSVSVYDPATGAVETRAVKVGLNTNVTAEILSGLAEGERVVAAAGTADATTASSSSRMGGPPMMGF
ncbi:efflux RND transporter periplasmic adaptor subunit [Frigidibacter mobilis]|uniref:Macrolide export ABC transporter macrolide-specific efflux protein MacA n=1 Tax=Frigidibacter mobilis TaxID=1335048 RepID=A0A165SWM8_9RHOB|nr:efflux RND transporter periplasmic adaptor subunit [Frigidibacter mobilis]AMY71939.1 macrolide export ABC transporter macrolide-specific efflux protein MacA [Frigidibacter mobilis]